MDWNALQECFRQQYSKFGSLREQYFHMWRSFRYDENEDTIDSYILKVKQVASLLNYGEPEILELFKNTLPSKLYWISFPINNLREAIDTAKRVMNKEKLDKQLTGQASNISPFMNMRDDTHRPKDADETTRFRGNDFNDVQYVSTTRQNRETIYAQGLPEKRKRSETKL